MKKLLEAWLTYTLVSLISKQALCTTTENTRDHVTQRRNEQDDQLNPPILGNTHATFDSAGDNVLVAVLKTMKEMENWNKALKEQMKEHQEHVDKVPCAPKLLPKRDAGWFVEQPYSEDVAPHAIPKTFKIPLYLRIYNGTIDP